MNYLKNNLYLAWIIVLVIVIFSPFIFLGRLPIPSDALVGLYHPWRDALKNDYANGFPYKNWLITDPVRQQFPYRVLAFDQIKRGEYPGWNPYSFAGTPLLANIQAAVFYPLNILLFFLPYEYAWSLMILLQPLMAGVFLYMYLKNLRLDGRAALLGGMSFAFCGFMVAWMTWNTIGHVLLWLPLILLAKDKLIESFKWRWVVILVFAEVSMIFGGHLQTAMYVFVFSTVYLWVRMWQKTRHNKKMFWHKRILFSITGIAALVISSIQWWPTLNFILASARQFDLPDWRRPDWFLPWKHLAQLMAPDFFGNPTTANYWGVFNYGEFVSYMGIIPLGFALFAILARRDKKTLFFALSCMACFLIALPNTISKIPYEYQWPFISSLQPSRILSLVNFCIAVLGALGLDYVLTQKKHLSKKAFLTVGILLATLVGLWFLARTYSPEHARIALRNLAIPLLLVGTFSMFLLVSIKWRILLPVICVAIFLMTSLDLFRFVHKFTPFTDKKLLFPSTATIDFLKHNLDYYRYMTNDRKILPPNASAYYRLQSVDGYDPLYLANYGGLVAAWTRQKPDITPASFNRILTPGIIESFFFDLLGVKYLVTPYTINDPSLKLVFEEGETKTYENLEAYPRAFLVEEVYSLESNEHVVEAMFENSQILSKTAYTTQSIEIPSAPLTADEMVLVHMYEENKVRLKVVARQERLLVLTDIYYPKWSVYVNDQRSEILPVDYALRGVVVPPGESVVEFRYN